ncbi:ester cyclase [Brucepastera parasyntrophica]|uniref:ester cyclase n=1 Tax=Brucepastera parasyntrophica TaxID=2880008 RepID=UPI00210E94B1|nr:ester cyclase [Brucepastera parasyntrophica]ULQ60370.1 ester cyclase [Brucepastera parasyntrophica]
MTNKDLVRNFFIEGYQNKNYDFVLASVSDAYIDHSPAGAKSNKEAAEILKLVAQMFGDVKIGIPDIFEEAGMVGARVRFEGIHTGECMGIPATGKTVSFEFLEHFKISGGKIAESWGYWPDLEILNILKSG